MVTLRPRASKSAPNEAAAIPLPSEDTTPPVIKTNRVMGFMVDIGCILSYWPYDNKVPPQPQLTRCKRAALRPDAPPPFFLLPVNRSQDILRHARAQSARRFEGSKQ